MGLTAVRLLLLLIRKLIYGCVAHVRLPHGSGLFLRSHVSTRARCLDLHWLQCLEGGIILLDVELRARLLDQRLLSSGLLGRNHR